MITILEWIYNFLKDTAGRFSFLIAPLLFALTVAISFLRFIHTILTWALAKLDMLAQADTALPAGQDWGSFTEAYVVMNTFFPLDTFLEILGVLAVIHVTAAIVRSVKSWIPTIGA